MWTKLHPVFIARKHGFVYLLEKIVFLLGDVTLFPQHPQRHADSCQNKPIVLFIHLLFHNDALKSNWSSSKLEVFRFNKFCVPFLDFFFGI